MEAWTEDWLSYVTITLEQRTRKSLPSLLLTAKAPCRYDETGEATLWASVSVDMATHAGGDFCGALLLLLYDLDAKALSMNPDLITFTA